MTSGSVSLLDFLDAPVVIGDPDSRVVYVNPAFQSCSGIDTSSVRGQPLAGLFDGGGREAVLRSVARVFELGESVRFRLRMNGVGYAAMASSIQSKGKTVGVVVLLSEELENDRRFLALHRGIHEPLDEIARCLTELAEATGGLRSSRYRQALDDGVRALGAVRKHAEEIQKILDGKK
jgi:PAS domain-containing protein